MVVKPNGIPSCKMDHRASIAAKGEDLNKQHLACNHDGALRSCKESKANHCLDGPNHNDSNGQCGGRLRHIVTQNGVTHGQSGGSGSAVNPCEGKLMEEMMNELKGKGMEE